MNAGRVAIVRTAGHELTHFIQENAPELYEDLKSFLVDHLLEWQGKSLSELVNEKMARDTTGELDFDGALDEVVADGCEMMLKRSSVVSTLARENPSLFDRIHAWLKEWAAKIRKAFSGVEAYHEEAKAMLSYMDQLQKIWDKALTEAARNAQTDNRSAQIENESAQNENDLSTEDRKMTASDGGRVQYEIREIEDSGRYYVQADRQVLTGTDSSKWGKQIENYINEQIRKNQDIAIPTTDGHVLILTARSAYKLSDQHVSAIASQVEQLLNDEDYARKGRIATHIDELIQVARFYRYRPDLNSKHKNDVGEDGFNYYNANFRDADGSYYLVQFSAGLNEKDETTYSIGSIRQRNFPAGKGSSSQGEALKNGRKASGDIIRTSEDKSQEVKTAIQIAYEKALAEKASKKEQRSERDAEYMEAVNNGNTAKAQRMVDEAARKAGYTKLFYHGSKKGGGFTVFHDWQYFTENKDYAMRYTQRDNPGSLYTVYAKMEHPFDTRDMEAAEIFANARQELGLGEIQESGLPDWTDGYDLSDYIDENELPYDSIILDEGGDLVDGKPVSRGLSYVIKDSSQVKSAEAITKDDNGKVIPLSQRFDISNRDIRFQERDFVPDDRQLLMEAASKRGSSAELKAYSRKVKQLDTLQHKLERQQAVLAEAEEQDKAATRKAISKTEQQIERAENALAKMEASPALKTEARSAMAAWREANPNQAAETLRRLREVNRALEKDLAYWKGQAKRTEPGENSVRPEDVRRMARQLIKDYSSEADRKCSIPYENHYGSYKEKCTKRGLTFWAVPPKIGPSNKGVPSDARSAFSVFKEESPWNTKSRL